MCGSLSSHHCTLTARCTCPSAARVSLVFADNGSNFMLMPCAFFLSTSALRYSLIRQRMALRIRWLSVPRLRMDGGVWISRPHSFSVPASCALAGTAAALITIAQRRTNAMDHVEKGFLMNPSSLQRGGPRDFRTSRSIARLVSRRVRFLNRNWPLWDRVTDRFWRV